MRLDELSFDSAGLLPAVVVDVDAGSVLMVGYVNRESLEKTFATGEVHFWSRSRGRLWRKGETSGNVLAFREAAVDCDRDCLLIAAEPAGPTCHTGARSCFFETLEGVTPLSSSLGDVLGRLARTVRERDRDRPTGSYTVEILDAGKARAAQKLGEEAVETVIAATGDDRDALAEESADLLYHLMVLWQSAGVAPSDVAEVLRRRAEEPS